MPKIHLKNTPGGDYTNQFCDGSTTGRCKDHPAVKNWATFFKTVIATKSSCTPSSLPGPALCHKILTLLTCHFFKSYLRSSIAIDVDADVPLLGRAYSYAQRYNAVLASYSCPEPPRARLCERMVKSCFLLRSYPFQCQLYAVKYPTAAFALSYAPA